MTLTGLGTPRPTDAGARKVVTIVFADLIGSTSLHERLDPESVSRLMDRYYQVVRTPVEAHGGSVVQLLGDGVMCAFGVPRAGEDDAIRAVRAAVGIQRAFRVFAREQSDVAGNLGLRVALNTGEVVVSDEHPAGIGDPLNVAARLQQEAHDGDVVIGEATHRLVSALVSEAPFGTFTLKGRSEPVSAYRVVSLEPPAGASASVFVGRDDELRRLTAVYDGAVATRRARLAVILGSPGLGKSRLIAEFVRRLGQGATVLTAHCDAAGGATFVPLADALRTLLGLDDAASGDTQRAAIDAVVPADDAERGRIVAGVAALLAGTPASPEETFFVIRRFLAALAATQPVVLAIDDLQWAEPLLLDLTEHLVQWSTEVPLFVLVAARPELRDTRSSLAAPGRLVADVVTLGGLDAAAATRLAASVIGADALPAVLAGRVLATSEGNPLFVGELVRMLVHDGALKREGDRWITGVELAALEMPPTIQALLAARIERLRPEERTVLERAAVVGRQFSRAAVAHLLPPEMRPDLDARLETLRRSELIEPDAGWLLGEPVLRFHHVLIRDAAYRRVLKGTRAELHGRFADWLEARVGETVEHDELVGWHLEQAHQHLRELGPIDERGRALGDRAARYLAAAGRRALARDDLSPAASLLGRAFDRLDGADPARADLALDWCEALLESGDVGPAARAIAELERFSHDSDRLRAWHTCFAGQLAVLTDPQALRATADAVAAAADELAAVGDAAGEAKGHLVHALALSRLGKIGACEAALDKALAAARRPPHDRRRANTVLAGAPVAALWGPSPVTRASGRCLDVVRVLRITQGAPAVEAVALRCQAVLEALRGRADAARRMIASSRHMVEELGITQQLLEADVFAGVIDLLEGDAVAAERLLRTAYDGLRDHGLGIDAARAAAFLGRALLVQGRAAEAEALSQESEALAGDDLQATITWRGVRAEALARRGEHAAGVDFARTAVDIAAATDGLLHHADARLALAAALRAAGRREEADAEEARAIELWEAKGATLLAERARRRAARADQVEQPREDRPAPARVHRQVRANAATALAARMVADTAARNADAFATLLADGLEIAHHPTSVVYGREGALATFQSFLKAQGGTYRLEPLATLGDSLALFHRSQSASAFAGRTFDVGAYETESIDLIEVDARGQYHRGEIFAADRLGDAVVRLYERYADLVPGGPERDRAAATAHSVAALPLVGAHDLDRLDRWATALAPAIEYLDHRTVGMGSVHGAEGLRRAVRALIDLSEDSVARIDDILALRSDALLVHWTHSGTDRASGGAFERRLCHLWIFGVDGLVTRGEQFDADRDAEVLARFNELTGAPAAARFAAAPSRVAERLRRRVHANAATACAARIDAAVAGRYFDAIPSLLADDSELLDHTTGATVDRRGELSSFRSLLACEDPAYRQEPLAILGDTLGLFRWSRSASGFADGALDVAAFEMEEISLFEVDAQGRHIRGEVFATGRLGNAIARLYERYADLLPDGPERGRAAATARSVAALPVHALVEPADVDRYAAVIAPALEFVDYRTPGMGSAHGAEAYLAWIHALFEVADDVGTRIEDILALRSDALLVRWTTTGTQRAGGGAFEQNLLMLWVFGTDGLVARLEQFPADRDDEALAHFDELTGTPAAARFVAAPSRGAERRERRVRPNAATAYAARVDAVMAARDADALPTLYADDAEHVHHPTHTTYGREGVLSSLRSFLSVRDPTFRHQPLATFGDSLALCHWSMSASGFASGRFDLGAYEREEIHLIEVDPRGQYHRGEFFAADRLGDGVARLYERYAQVLPTGPAHARAAATARSVAAMLGPFEVAGYATAIAPDLEFADHRHVSFGSGHGAEAFLHALQALLDVSDSSATRVDDILDLRPDALLVHWTNFGTARAGGGAFERPFLFLWVVGTDGLLTHLEQFEVDHDAEALARLDELTAEPAAVRFAAAPPRVAKKLERRVRANAVTAHAARLDAAIAARDADAIADLFADDAKGLEHPTGATVDRRGLVFSFCSLLSAQDPTMVHEPLATLGEALALCRAFVSASGYAGGKLDVGPYEREDVLLIEVDARGQRRWSEVFAADRLGDAVARLYERYADLLPDGPACTRAAATARSVAAYVGPFDPDRCAAAFAPGIEVVDHRILGTWSARGAEALLHHYRSMLELTDDTAFREDEILNLQPDAFLVRRTFSGTDRAGGGAFERQFIQLWIFGNDGLMTRLEYFDAERDAEAFARFDELTAEPAAARLATAPARTAKRHARRVRANAATANAARVDAAIIARDADAIADLLADDVEGMEHPVGAGLDRPGILFSYRALLSARDPTSRHEPLATLGEALALCRWSMSASGFAGGKLDVGAYEKEEILLLEVDARGRRWWYESFTGERLGDAVARLYERYADLLPDGPARTRAAATARAVATLVGPLDLDRYVTAFAPALEFVDHRMVGYGSARGATTVLRGLHILLELATDVVNRTDDIFGLRSDALLVRLTNFGTARAGGGEYERPFLLLWVFGSDGLATRGEQFDVDHEDEALARFDELTAEPATVRFAAAPSRVADERGRRVHANAATATATRQVAAFAARNADALAALYADGFEGMHHPSGTVFGKEGVRASYHALLKAQGGMFQLEPLATLGDSLALCRQSMSGSGFVGRTFDVGAYEIGDLLLMEVDARGQHQRDEVFATDRLGSAIAGLYQRYADLLPDGPARARAAATARSVAASLGPVDPSRFATAYAPAIEAVDHRVLGTWSARGAEAALRHNRSLLEVAADVALREDDILDLRSDAFLVRRTHVGTDRAGGGAYERLFLMLFVFGTDGLVTRVEYFDADREAEALARFDQVTAGPPATVRITNAATRSGDRFREAWEARDWERVAGTYAPAFRLIDRRTLMHFDLDRDGQLDNMRMIFGLSSSRFTGNVLATRSERLSLSLEHFEGTDRTVGPSEVDWLGVAEVDDAGDLVARVLFDPDDLKGAYAELDRRYAAGEAVPYARTWETLQRFVRAVVTRDWEALASVFDPDLVLEDHRPIGLWTLHSRDDYLASVHAIVDLAPDVTFRVDHVLALDDRRALSIVRWTGSREDGSFEIPLVAVPVFDSDGRVQRFDTYNLEQLDEARARFEAIRMGAARDPLAALARPNAASAVGERLRAAFVARDWAAMRALCAPDAKFEDRGRRALVSGDVDWWIADLQGIASMRNTRFERQLVGTAGDRVALNRVLLSGDPGGAAVAAATGSPPISSLGPFEIEALWVTEVDESGRITAGVAFDVDDWRAATREAWARWFARDAVAAASVGPVLEFVEAINEHDRARLRAALADDCVLHDHRPARLGLIEGADALAESWAALWDLALDAQVAGAGTLAHARYGLVGLARTFGTLPDGGTFENPTASVAIVANGRITRLELFEPEHVDAALARFAELRPDPLRVPPNAATRANDRLWEYVERSDRDSLRALCAPIVYEDRRRLIRTSGDCDMFVANANLVARWARRSRTILATAGDRLMLQHLLWTAHDERAAFDAEMFEINEVDREGRVVAAIYFDPDDRRAASAELLDRYARSDEARGMPAAGFEALRAMNAHDLDRLRAALPDDYVLDDHRRVGLGRLEGADAYLASVAALFEQAPDMIIEPLYIVATEKHGFLAMAHGFGTLPDGGEFEQVYVWLGRCQGDRLVGMELFEPEDLDVARARFEELRPDPVGIPPKGAARTRSRHRTRRGARVARTPRARKR